MGEALEGDLALELLTLQAQHLQVIEHFFVDSHV